MKMKATKFSLFGLLALFLVFTACEDDFSEQDLLELQAELAETKAQNDFERRLQELAAMAEDAQEYAVLQDQLSRATQEYIRILQDALNDENDSTDAANALALLRSAGFVVQYDVAAVANDAAVSGIAVQMVTAGGLTLNDTTQASGIVSFVDVPTGLVDVSLSGDNYLPIAYTIDFGSPNDNIISVVINGSSVSLVDPVSGRSTVQMVASGSITGAATVSGTAEGNVDLTSADEELLEGLVVVASLATVDSDAGDDADNNLISTTGSFNGSAGTVSQVKFAIDGFTMTDTTDASGEYSIMVPASEDISFAYDITFPELITTNQFLAAVNESTDSAEVVAVEAVWGVGVTTTVADIPEVNGWEWTSPSAPDAYGTGLAITMEDTINDGLNLTGIDNILDAAVGTRDNLETQTVNGNTRAIQVATYDNAGTSLNFATPTATVTGGTGTAADIQFERTYSLASSTVALTTDATAGRYTASTNAGDLYLAAFGNDPDAGNNADTVIIYLSAVTAAADGGLTTTEFANLDITTLAAQQLSVSTDDPANNDVTWEAGGGADERNFEDVAFVNLGGTFSLDGISDLNITGTGFEVFFIENTANVADDTQTAPEFTYTEGTITVSDLDINFDTSNGGSYITAPSTITWGTTGQITINAMAFRYEFSLNNASSAGYKVVPETIQFTGSQFAAGSSVTVTETNTSADVDSYAGATYVETDDLSNLLTVDSDTLQPYNSSVTEFRTQEYFIGAPTLATVEDQSAAAFRTPTFTSGTLTGLSGSDNGNGYTSKLTFTLAGRSIASNAAGNGLDLTPTTAASISIADGNYTTNDRTKEVQWDGGGASIDDAGEGYVDEINYRTADGFQINGAAATTNASTVTATVNGEFTVNVNYGTGTFVDEDLVLQGDN